MTVAMVTGLPAGLGCVAVFGLVADRFTGRLPSALDSLVQVGRRSLTCYLAQSLVFAPLLCAWGLGLGGWIGSAQAFGIAVFVWLLTVVLATWLDRTRRRGPAEVLLRRLTCGTLDVPPAALVSG